MNKRINQMKGIVGFFAVFYLVLSVIVIVFGVSKLGDGDALESMIGATLIGYGIGALALIWVAYVFVSFLIEWSENTFDMRNMIQEISVGLKLGQDRFSNPSTQIAKPDFQDKQSVQEVQGNEEVSQTDAQKEMYAFDVALTFLSKGYAIENGKYKIQKNSEGKMIIAAKIQNNGQLIFEYFSTFGGITEVQKSKWSLCKVTINPIISN